MSGRRELAHLCTHTSMYIRHGNLGLTNRLLLLVLLMPAPVIRMRVLTLIPDSPDQVDLQKHGIQSRIVAAT